MIFSKFFHLSREGTRTIMQAGIWLAVFNLAALLPRGSACHGQREYDDKALCGRRWKYPFTAL